MAARHKEGYYWEASIVSIYDLVCKERSKDRRRRGGCRGTPHFIRYGRELVLKPAISVKKSWGRLPCSKTQQGGYVVFLAFIFSGPVTRD